MDKLLVEAQGDPRVGSSVELLAITQIFQLPIGNLSTLGKPSFEEHGREITQAGRHNTQGSGNLRQIDETGLLEGMNALEAFNIVVRGNPYLENAGVGQNFEESFEMVEPLQLEEPGLGFGGELEEGWPV